MSIENCKDPLGLTEAGGIARLALAEMASRVRAGMTTLEIAEFGTRVMQQNGARSAPRIVYGFPGDVLISLNDEAVHGIPDERMIRTGALVKLDVTFEKNGYMADAAMTVPVEPVSDEARRLAVCAERAFQKAMWVARANHRVNEIGRAVEREVRQDGFHVLRELGGHGIGRTIHEAPSVPNYEDPLARQRLTPGLVLTVEPIIAAGKAKAIDSGDHWTVKTSDGSLSAHYEHTIVITEGEPILLNSA